MMIHDARQLPPNAQADLRRKVVKAVRNGMKKSHAARTFEVSRQAIDNWLGRYDDGGLVALRPRKRGRPKGIRLQPHQAATTVKLIMNRCPDQLHLPFVLWTREAVCNLIERRFGIHISVNTAGRYLHRWGMSPQKPVRRAYEQNPQAVERWLKEEYPAIVRRAKREKAEIHWGDEMGLRSDHQTGRSWGKKGETPVVPGTGKRFSCSMISTVTNRGRLSFMVFTERFTATVFLRFLKRLIRHADRKVFLIVDGLSVHKAAKVKKWIKAHADLIDLFLLPPYSPELNPDELLNNDVKSNALGRRRPSNQDELVQDTRSYLRSTQRRPDIVEGYFREKHVRYAAAA